MKGGQRVVLVGDHKQLPPVVKNRDAEAGGLGMSLFERLMHLGAPSAMLQVTCAGPCKRSCKVLHHQCAEVCEMHAVSSSTSCVILPAQKHLLRPSPLRVTPTCTEGVPSQHWPSNDS
jgi:hypothetical protein